MGSLGTSTTQLSVNFLSTQERILSIQFEMGLLSAKESIGSQMSWLNRLGVATNRWGVLWRGCLDHHRGYIRQKPPSRFNSCLHLTGRKQRTCWKHHDNPPPEKCMAVVLCFVLGCLLLAAQAPKMIWVIPAAPPVTEHSTATEQAAFAHSLTQSLTHRCASTPHRKTNVYTHTVSLDSPASNILPLVLNCRDQRQKTTTYLLINHRSPLPDTLRARCLVACWK